MPLNKEIKKVLVIGSGPIVIGQAAEFDYSGTQAVNSLIEEGIEVVLINSNPATIMTDKETAHKVYIEPLTEDFILRIIHKEKPDGVLATLGGQTALNLAVKLEEKGILKKLGVKLLGCSVQTIKEAEDRKMFRDKMLEIGEPICESRIITTLEEAFDFTKEIGYPIIIRPAYTLGGTGGGIAHNETELITIVNSGISASPINQVLIERSIAGYKEIEYEVIRDANDTCIVVCNMENFDPVGVHTGDSIVFAPSQTLSDKEYQLLRSSSLKIVRSLDIKGGCNVQLALDPHSFNYYVIEVNPRVSRSSALASKATGYPIAKIAAKISIGLNLDEIINPVTKKTYASFEPSLDYVVCKIPRWPFDKFTTADRKLGTQMKATGEVMGIGRNIEESILKSVRCLEIGTHHLEFNSTEEMTREELLELIKKADDERIFLVAEAIRRGTPVDLIHQNTKIDMFFLNKIRNIIMKESELRSAGSNLTADLLTDAKKLGFNDATIGKLTDLNEQDIRELRNKFNIKPVFKMVDTCAAEFESHTPYYYSTYEDEDEVEETDKEKIVVLGSGPIRIGQGIEFDYATVHAIAEIREMGYEAIVINNNPETVSTDFNISDRLYFEPLTTEDVLNIIDREKPLGVIVQFGGQTAINLAESLAQNGVKILGSSLESIDQAEDRRKFEKIMTKLGIAQPLGTTVSSFEEAMLKTKDLGFPAMVRPSYVLGGRAMEVVYSQDELKDYLNRAVQINPQHPVLIDRYLLGKEIEVDAICDGENVLIPGIMEHIEKAGVHSGDSMAVYPTQNVNQQTMDKLVKFTESIAKELKIIGLINIQFVLYKGEAYVLEVNPRSSRTVPFLSKVTDIQMAKVATRAILGQSLKEQGLPTGLLPAKDFVAVKAPVFSFAKLSDVEIALGPEMKSTGEVMGKDRTFEKALHKAFMASGVATPNSGTIVVTVADKNKDEVIPIIKRFHNIGFNFVATEGTAKAISQAQVPVMKVDKIDNGEMDILSYVKSGQADILINTISNNRKVEIDGLKLRRAAVEQGMCCLTSLDTVEALLRTLEKDAFEVSAL